MRRLLFVAILALVLAPLVRAADKPVEVGHIPASFPVAISFDAVKLKKNLTALGVPVDKAIEKAKEKKIELENLSRGTVLLDFFPGGNSVASPVFIGTTKEATAKSDVQKVLESETEGTVGGKKVIKGKEKMAGQDVFGTAVDDKTFVIAPESTLEKVFKDGAKGGDLTTEFEKADLKHDAVIVLAMKPLLATLKEKFGDKLDSQIPPAAEQFWAAAKRIEAATLTVNLSEETLLKGVFRADSAEGADLVKDTLQGLTALLSIALPQVKQQLGTQLPPEAKPLIAVIEAMAKSSKFKVDGSTVTMTVARPKDFGK